MSSQVLTGITELVTNDPTHPDGDGSPLGIITDAALVVGEDGRIEWVGRAGDAPEVDEQLDVGGHAVIPGFVDSHSHLVFAGDRSAEFAARMTGEPYTGGGIATTVAATREASDDDLRAHLKYLTAQMRAMGTTTVEIKSGYGLDVENEKRSLRLASEFTSETTFLGGHVVPFEFREDREAYVELVTGEMLRECAPLARWADVFCEPGSAHAFDGDESRRILEASRAAGLELRVHGNQLTKGPGVQLAVDLAAASVDHCTFLTDGDVEALASSSSETPGTGSDLLLSPAGWNSWAGTVATLLPGVEFSTRQPYPDARRLLSAGAVVALASDCNPGTCYSSSMALMMALAVREMGMTPAEALWSATAGGALALRRGDIGHLTVGAQAHVALVYAPTYLHLVYRPGIPLVWAIDLGSQSP